MSETERQPSAPAVTIREAVGVFRDWNALQAAVDELQVSGFDRSEISLLAGSRTVEEKLGHVYAKVGELEDDPKAARAAYIGRDSLVEARTGIIGGLAYVGAVAAVGAIVASGGTLAAAIIGAVAAGGGGGLIGTIAAKWLGRERAKDMQAQLDKGGLLLWIRIRDGEHERRAVDILTRHAADDVHVHDLPASAQPEIDPLVGFEPDPFLPKARV
ncbi:MAG: hypothetical protein ACFCUO_12355 [Rhodospirillales bacterium]